MADQWYYGQYHISVDVDQETDNQKIAYFVVHPNIPNGKYAPISPYERNGAEAVQLWIDLGMPPSPQISTWTLDELENLQRIRNFDRWAGYQASPVELTYIHENAKNKGFIDDLNQAALLLETHLDESESPYNREVALFDIYRIVEKIHVKNRLN